MEACYNWLFAMVRSRQFLGPTGTRIRPRRFALYHTALLRCIIWRALVSSLLCASLLRRSSNGSSTFVQSFRPPSTVLFRGRRPALRSGRPVDFGAPSLPGPVSASFDAEQPQEEQQGGVLTQAHGESDEQRLAAEGFVPALYSRTIWPEFICCRNRKRARCILNVYQLKISMRGRGGAEVSHIGTLEFGVHRKQNCKQKVGRFLVFESWGFEIRNQRKKRIQNDVVHFVF